MENGLVGLLEQAASSFQIVRLIIFQFKIRLCLMY